MNINRCLKKANRRGIKGDLIMTAFIIYMIIFNIACFLTGYKICTTTNIKVFDSRFNLILLTIFLAEFFEYFHSMCR